MAAFDVYSNYNPNAGVRSVIIGERKPVLESEFNESQEIQINFLRNVLRHIAGSGCFYEGTMNYAAGSITITNEHFLVDGYYIFANSLTKAAAEGQSIYLDTWVEDADYNATLKQYGNQQSTAVTNYLFDARLGMETSRRKILKYDLTTTNGVAGHTYLKIGQITSGSLVLTAPNIVNTSLLTNNSVISLTLTGSNTLTATSLGFTSYVTNMKFRCKVAATNTGAATFSLNGMTAKNVKRISPFTGSKVSLVGGELKIGTYVDFIYDGTDIVLMGDAILTFSTSYDPVSLLAGQMDVTTLTVPGAELGDQVNVSFDLDVSGLWIRGDVTALNTVKVSFFNMSNVTVNLNSGNIRLRIIKV